MRMIVSDLDGTLLLRGEKKLHKTSVSVLEKLICGNVVFCVASGRSYSELKRIFGELSDKIFFVANDGALIMYKGKNIYDVPISAEKVRSFEDEENVVAHGRYVSFVKSYSERFVRGIKEQYCGHILRTDSLEAVTEPIYKIALYGKTEKTVDLNRVYCGSNVCEYVECGINKGVAVAELSRILKIAKSDIYAVGDGINDIEMFKAAEKSYVISSAPPRVKKNAKYIVNDFKAAAEILLEE